MVISGTAKSIIFPKPRQVLVKHNDLTIRKNAFEKKAFSKETPHGGNLIFRIAAVAFPILEEFEPFSYPLYVLRDGYYLVGRMCALDNATELAEIAQELLATSLYFAYLIWTILENELGDKISTIEDLLTNLYGMVGSLTNLDYIEFFEEIFNVIDDSVWLCSYYYCRFEIKILGYALDTLYYLYNAIKDFKKDNNLEGIGELILAVIKVKNIVPYIPKIKDSSIFSEDFLSQVQKIIIV